MTYETRVKSATSQVYDGGCEIHAIVLDRDLPHVCERIESALAHKFQDISLEGVKAFHKNGLPYSTFMDTIGVGVLNGKKGFARVELISLNGDHSLILNIGIPLFFE